MSLHRILNLAAAVVAVATAVAVVVVASSYAVYAVARLWLGAAGAAALVAAVYALFAAVLALLATRKAQPNGAGGAPTDEAFVNGLAALAKERPILARGAAAAAATAATAVLARNPGLVNVLVNALLGRASSAKAAKSGNS